MVSVDLASGTPSQLQRLLLTGTVGLMSLAAIVWVATWAARWADERNQCRHDEVMEALCHLQARVDELEQQLSHQTHQMGECVERLSTEVQSAMPKAYKSGYEAAVIDGATGNGAVRQLRPGVE